MTAQRGGLVEGAEVTAATPRGSHEDSAYALTATALVKLYGDVRALDGVDLAVPEGSVFGFLGPNGAGKTTTLRILTGLARPTSGTASVFGREVTTSDSAARALIGFLPDVPGFYGWMTAEEYLRFAGELFGLGGRTLAERVSALLDLAGLTGVRTRIGGYSRGMKQRLGVAQALVNAPRLLMLDEPTSALDPIGRKQVLDMLASLRGRTTVFFSTHILADIERVCDTVAILDHGRIVAQAPIDELKARYATHRIALEIDGPTADLVDALKASPWVNAVDVDREGALSIAVSDVEAAQHALPVMVAQRGLGMLRLEGGEVALEDVFVELVSGGGRAAEEVRR